MNNNRGYILTITVTFVLVFTMLGIGSIYLSTVMNEAAEKRTASTKAFWLAEAGLQKAIWEREHNNCRGLMQEGTSTFCSSCTSCGSGNKALAASLNGAGDYDVVMDSTNKIITSIGSFPNRSSTSPIFSRRKIQYGNSIFQWALFGDKKVEVGNNLLVDSYNSEDGSSCVLSLPNDCIGNIGTNATTGGVPGAIAFSTTSNATVSGVLSTGLGGTVTKGQTSVPGNILETGDAVGSGSPITVTHDNNVDLPPAVVPASLSSLPPTGINLNATATLPTGSYKYSKIDLVNETLTVNGDVQLYLTNLGEAFRFQDSKLIIPPGSNLTIYTNGKFIVRGNASYMNDPNHTASGGVPSQLQVLSTYTLNPTFGDSGVQLNDSDEFRMTIYAPETNVAFDNNAKFFGAAIGETIEVKGNAEFHYDESLGNGGASENKWQELPI